MIAANQSKRKVFPPWKNQESITMTSFENKQDFKVKEIKERSSKGEHPKTAKKGETSKKDKATTIFMVQPWQRMMRKKTSKNLSPIIEISFPPLEDEDGEDHPTMIKA
ncbi:hypothetical protein Tco_0487234 [Tanacetum coccineum]